MIPGLPDRIQDALGRPVEVASPGCPRRDRRRGCRSPDRLLRPRDWETDDAPRQPDPARRAAQQFLRPRPAAHRAGRLRRHRGARPRARSASIAMALTSKDDQRQDRARRTTSQVELDGRHRARRQPARLRRLPRRAGGPHPDRLEPRAEPLRLGARAARALAGHPDRRLAPQDDRDRSTPQSSSRAALRSRSATRSPARLSRSSAALRPRTRSRASSPRSRTSTASPGSASAPPSAERRRPACRRRAAGAAERPRGLPHRRDHLPVRDRGRVRRRAGAADRDSPAPAVRRPRRRRAPAASSPRRPPTTNSARRADRRGPASDRRGPGRLR